MYFPLCVPARAAANAENLKKPDGPRKLYVGNLHPNINEIMLKAVFEPFGMVRMCVRRRQQLNVTFLPLDCVTEFVHLWECSHGIAHQMEYAHHIMYSVYRPLATKLHIPPF